MSAILDFLEVLCNTYDVTSHVQNNLGSKKYPKIDFKTKNYYLFEIFR